MSDPRVLCLGEMLVDRLASQPGPLDAVTAWTDYPGGAPANVACALSKLGISAGFVGCLGNDPNGARAIATLRAAGVDLRGIQQHPTAPTRQVYVTRTPDGDREFAGFGGLPADSFADAQLQGDRLPVPLFETAEVLVLGTLELAYRDAGRAVRQALSLATTNGLKVVLDVNLRLAFWSDPAAIGPTLAPIWSQVDFVKLAREEALWLFDTVEAAAIAYQLESVEGVLITDGANPTSYYLNGAEGKVPSFAVEVADTTGAGDAFVAGFVQQLCQRGIARLGDPEVARAIVTYACAVGALTATRPGAMAQPTAAEVAAFLTSARSQTIA